jgi:Domain of unknown function (DUF6458)
VWDGLPFPGVFLIAVGAIITFALDLRVSGVNLDVVGWILMAVGALGLVVTLIVWGNRRSSVVTSEPTSYRRVEERSDLGATNEYSQAA